MVAQTMNEISFKWWRSLVLRRLLLFLRTVSKYSFSMTSGTGIYQN